MLYSGKGTLLKVRVLCKKLKKSTLLSGSPYMWAKLINIWHNYNIKVTLFCYVRQEQLRHLISCHWFLFTAMTEYNLSNLSKLPFSITSCLKLPHNIIVLWRLKKMNTNGNEVLIYTGFLYSILSTFTSSLISW